MSCQFVNSSLHGCGKPLADAALSEDLIGYHGPQRWHELQGLQLVGFDFSLGGGDGDFRLRYGLLARRHRRVHAPSKVETRDARRWRYLGFGSISICRDR